MLTQSRHARGDPTRLGMVTESTTDLKETVAPLPGTMPPIWQNLINI